MFYELMGGREERGGKGGEVSIPWDLHATGEERKQTKSIINYVLAWKGIRATGKWSRARGVWNPERGKVMTNFSHEVWADFAKMIGLVACAHTQTQQIMECMLKTVSGRRHRLVKGGLP